MYQAGIKQVTLYENKDITFRFYDPLNLYAITDLANEGQQITIENLSRPEFDIKLGYSKGGKVTHDYALNFLLLGLTLENYETLNSLKTSIYGWCMLVEFYDGTFKFYPAPLSCRESDIKPHSDMAFSVKLTSPVPSVKKYYEYDPDVSAVPVYRWDTTLLSWDDAIHTFDYEL